MRFKINRKIPLPQGTSRKKAKVLTYLTGILWRVIRRSGVHFVLVLNWTVQFSIRRRGVHFVLVLNMNSVQFSIRRRGVHFVLVLNWTVFSLVLSWTVSSSVTLFLGTVLKYFLESCFKYIIISWVIKFRRQCIPVHLIKARENLKLKARVHICSDLFEIAFRSYNTYKWVLMQKNPRPMTILSYV